MYDSFKPAQPFGLMDFVRAAKACVTEITPQELGQKLAAREDLVLIDAREHSEYEHGHINGAHLVPRGILEAAADPAYAKHYPPLSQETRRAAPSVSCTPSGGGLGKARPWGRSGAREKPVVVYCATGGRSAMAAAVLQMMGFKQVYSLAGGYGRWHAEGMPEIHEAEF